MPGGGKTLKDSVVKTEDNPEMTVNSSSMYPKTSIPRVSSQFKTGPAASSSATSDSLTSMAQLIGGSIPQYNSMNHLLGPGNPLFPFNSPLDPLLDNILGGGGSQFNPLLAALLGNQKNSDLIVKLSFVKTLSSSVNFI